MINTDGGFTLSFSIPELYPLEDPIFFATASRVIAFLFPQFPNQVAEVGR
jgi:hypothetical protein